MLRRGLERIGNVLSQNSAASLQNVRGLKRSTYLTGVAVDPKAEINTPAMLSDVLNKVSMLPAEVAYRQHVERYCNNFLSIISEAPTQADAEEKLGRQFEEIQLDCEKELALIDRMMEWKPWDVSPTHDIKMFLNVKDIPSNVRRFRENQAELASRS